MSVEAATSRVGKQTDLGRLLASVEGYAVLDRTGRHIGRVEHVRYQLRVDRPDEIVVRRGRLWRRRQAVPFRAVEAVDRRNETVTLTIDG